MSKSNYFHIVMSPKSLPDPTILQGYISDKADSWVLSREVGDSGHPHLEVYAHFVYPSRSDSVRRAILNLYPSIPKPEHRNIKVCINHIDSDPRYGYGYALKEGDIINTTLTPSFQDECLEYYYSRKDQVKSVMSKSKSKKMSVDEVAVSYADFVFTSDRRDVNSHSFHSYVESLVYPDNLISYSTYNKCRWETLEPYINCIIRARGRLEL